MKKSNKKEHSFLSTRLPIESKEQFEKWWQKRKFLNASEALRAAVRIVLDQADQKITPEDVKLIRKIHGLAKRSRTSAEDLVNMLEEDAAIPELKTMKGKK
ncbi:MAG: hypothetical protein P8Y47_02305 [Alphaproteobacteria bacterium]